MGKAKPLMGRMGYAENDTFVLDGQTVLISAEPDTFAVLLRRLCKERLKISLCCPEDPTSERI